MMIIRWSRGLFAAVLVPCAYAYACAGTAWAEGESPAAANPALRWQAVPRIEGRLSAAQIGLVINEDDPYSVAVGEHYIAKRGLLPAQVLRLRFAPRPSLSPPEFAPLREQIQAHFNAGGGGVGIQALALAWRMPWAVACNSITSAVTLGFDAEQCVNGCARGRSSPYFAHPTALPYNRLGLRPSMLLAADSVDSALEMIDRGVASDGHLGKRFSPWVEAVFVSTPDAARNVRAVNFPPSTRLNAPRVEVRSERQRGSPERQPGGEPMVLYQTGAVSVQPMRGFFFAPGAVADHLTSTAGVLDGSSGQMSATRWIEAGATASYGTVSEPCNHVQKFPQPQLLLQTLLQGSTVLEAYWKSVAWPAQGVFIGEPLAAPFASTWATPPSASPSSSASAADR
ncbi:TIGR03790 family protein [Ideonella sp.]|uniref:TIGR03790 family protein n=1 Tax=Ideonella sp. TaxID=1929293 RepID=UPI003BB6B965